jgi:putative hydrolase of the HAD superfamily
MSYSSTRQRGAADTTSRHVVRRNPVLFFDVDGTLVDHNGAQRAAVLGVREAFPDVLAALPREKLIDAWAEAETRWFERYLAGELSFADQRRRRIAEVWKICGAGPVTDRQADEIFESYLGRYEASWTAFDDVAPALDGLSDVPVGVITNGDTDQQMRKLDGAGLGGVFSPVVTSGAVGAAKPRREIFIAGARAAGVAPGGCYYVGDRLETDAVPASRAGMRGVWLDRQNLDEPVPQGVSRITRLTELAALVM